MTRTTELLKALEKSQRRNTCKETKEEHKLRIESELHGRLDALKEEVEFLEYAEEYSKQINEDSNYEENLKDRLASIQEEIKLIDGMI